MGVDLGDLVPRESRRLSDFSGRVIAIDAYNALYQFLAIIRQPDGTPLKDRQGRVTSHLSGLFYRTANLAEAGIRPVYVFDGKPHEWKSGTLLERSARKEKAATEYAEAAAAGDIAKMRTKAMQTSRLTREMTAQAKSLLDALGIPWVQAPSEGEAQASHMAARGDVWAAASQDFDSILFGAPLLVRNLTVTGKRKLPGKNVSVDVVPEVIEFEKALEATGLTRDGLIAVGILCGTDYNTGVKGVGPKRASKLVKSHGTLEGVLAHLGHEWTGPDLDELKGLFTSPQVTDEYAFEFGSADGDRVRALLCGEHGFSKDRVDAAIPRFGALAEKMKQRSLDAFF